MAEMEALGDAATGGVLARAVEPAAGEGDGQAHAPNCLNCGCALEGAFCHSCGQKAKVHRTLAGFGHDLVHGVLHFEGKIWRTLPMLAWRPGTLTRRYIDGQRASFVSPIALFLFSVFLMYALVGWTTKSSAWKISSTLEETIAEERKSLRDSMQERSSATGAEASRLDREILETREDIARLEELRSKGVTTATFEDRAGAQGDALFKSAFDKAKQNPDLLIYKLKTNAYKFSWALIPISLPFVWLLFPFSRRFTLYDHIVFVTYSLGFMTLLVVAAILIGAVGLGSIASLLTFIPPVHMFFQLKGTYGLSTWAAAWRTLLLLAFAFAAVSLFSGLLLMLGLLD